MWDRRSLGGDCYKGIKVAKMLCCAAPLRRNKAETFDFYSNNMIHKTSLAPLRLTLVGLHLLSGMFQVALIYPHVGQQKRQFMKQLWSRQLLWILGVRLSAQALAGDPNRLDGLLACNHISFVDIFVINAVAPTSFVAKSEVAAWPAIGWLCAHTDTLFIERASRGAAHRTHRRLVERLGSGQSVAIFPEGTSSRGDSVLAFHSALFQSAIDAGVPVRCLALSYHGPDGSPSLAPAYIDDISLWQCLWTIARCGGLHVRLRELPAIETGTTDRRQLAHQAHRLIARGLAANRAEPAANMSRTWTEYRGSRHEETFDPVQPRRNKAAMKQ